MKCVLQVIERISRIEGFYKDRDVWHFSYTKLLWEKVGGKHFLSEFRGRNQNEEVYWKTLCNNMILEK